MFKKSLTSCKEKSHMPNGKGYESADDLSFSYEERKPIRDYSADFKFALVSFFVSIIIVCSKLVLVNRTLLQKLYVNGKTYWATSSFGTYRLLSDDSRTKISELISSNVMRDFLDHFNWFLLPVLAGLGMTALTWCMVYIDSCVPGIKPPTPLSPNKIRTQHSPRFHLGYIVAIVNGFLVFLLMVFSWY